MFAKPTQVGYLVCMDNTTATTTAPAKPERRTYAVTDKNGTVHTITTSRKVTNAVLVRERGEDTYTVERWSGSWRAAQNEAERIGRQWHIAEAFATYAVDPVQEAQSRTRRAQYEVAQVRDSIAALAKHAVTGDMVAELMAAVAELAKEVAQ